jgi:hypothetical protein
VIARLVTVAAVVGVLLTGAAPARAGDDSGGLWISPTVALNEWVARDAELTAAVAGTSPFNVNTPMKGEVFEPATGTVLTSFWSLAELRAATDLVPGATVMYDLEYNPNSTATVSELRHPRHSLRTFVELAHDRGLRVVFAPSPSLTSVPGQTWCTREAGEDQPHAFIRCRLPAFAASVGTDLLLVQSQRLECDLDTYRSFVRAAAEQDPATLAELTVVWPDPCVTARVVYRAWRSVRPYVAGYGFWSQVEEYAMIPVIRPWAEQTAMALRVFRRISATA